MPAASDEELSHYENRINNLSLKEWEPLLSFIPRIKSTDYFGEMVIDTSDSEVKHFPYSMPSELVNEFFDTFYKYNYSVKFDWIKWVEQFRELDEEVDFDTLDLADKTKYIQAIIRQNRFIEGLLVSTFQEGTILRILESIERKVNK